MNMDFYNSMPADVQQALMEEYQWWEDQFALKRTEELKMALDGLGMEGCEVYTLPDAERATWRETTQPVYDKYFNEIGPEQSAIIKAALENAAAVK